MRPHTVRCPGAPHLTPTADPGTLYSGGFHILTSLLHSLPVRLLPLCLVMAMCLAAPVYARHDGKDGGKWTHDGDNNQGNADKWNPDEGGPGPAIPEPSGWLAMGLGLMVVGPYARSRWQR